MRRDGKRTTRRPWRRGESSRGADPAKIVDELHRRRLGTIEDCRIAWERGGDPLAVCAAVAKTEMPPWLADAVLGLLYWAAQARLGRGPTVLQKFWAHHERDVLDAKRAWEVARARAHPDLPQTWDMAYRVANRLVKRDGAGLNLAPVTEAAMKKSYGLVSRRLAKEGRYYWAEDDLGPRLDEAQQCLIRIMANWVAAAPEEESPPTPRAQLPG